MNVEILPSSPHSPREEQVLTSFLVNDTVAIDAGALGLRREGPGQNRVHHVFLTHAHADHICSLPIFMENIDSSRGDTVTVHGNEATISALREHVFNGRIWPDYERLAEAKGEPGRLRYHILGTGERARVDGLEITAVPVDHVVPTHGYLVDDGNRVVAFGGDSGPTEALWEEGAGSRRLRAAFLEATFPDALIDLARRTGHLTPRLLAAEAAKLPSETEVVAVHIRPRHRHRVVSELLDLGLPRLRIGYAQETYRFE